MSGLQDIHGPISRIYHEKQQPGSMLCAQHALNNLLQSNFFTAHDLSDIARELDLLEVSYDTESNAANTSTNMDDTGFFSVQVLDKALEVWGLDLTPWQSETLLPYHNHPEKIPAFILNLDQHWFTLRRFGDANSVIDVDEGNGLWFNLNSFLPVPEWLSKTFLGMVIQQAEAEGYSVFAVTQADPQKPLALFRTQADMLFSAIAEPTSSSRSGLENSLATLKGASQYHTDAMEQDIPDFEDDFELQRALQASLANEGSGDPPSSAPAGPIPPTLQAASSSAAQMANSSGAEVDPVTASMERNRLLLQRMKEQQEEAQREIWSEEDLSPEEQAVQEERRARRRQQEVEEEKQLLRAIEESTRQHVEQQMAGPDADLGMEGGSHDEELQAALRASLELHQSLQAGQTPSTPGLTDPDSETDDDETLETIGALEEPVEAAPSLEEIRQARLARFGQ